MYEALSHLLTFKLVTPSGSCIIIDTLFFLGTPAKGVGTQVAHIWEEEPQTWICPCPYIQGDAPVKVNLTLL